MFVGCSNRPARAFCKVLIAVTALVAVSLVVPATPAVAHPDNPPQPVCTHPQPDVSAARAAVAVCGRPIEVLSLRTEHSQTFLNVDGSFTLERSIEPVRVRKGSTWVPVDPVLKMTSKGVEPRATVLPMVFSPGGDGPLARLRDGDRELAMSWPGRLPVPVLQGDTAIYRDVLPGVDLRVTANALGFSETLVVRTREAAQNPKLASLRFGLATKGLTVTADDGGGLVARDDEGKTVFTSPAPLMWDSSTDEPGVRGGPESAKGEPTPPRQKSAEAKTTPAKPGDAGSSGGARQAVMSVRVERDALTIVPDLKLLTDPEAKLPIYIDPSWTGQISGDAWTSVWSKYKSSSFWRNSTALRNGSTYGSAGVGRTEDCSGCADYIIRSFFRMDTSAVRGKHILNAKFRIEQRHAWTCSPKSNAKLWLTGSISSSTTWNNQPTWNSSYTSTTPANRKVGAIHGCAGPGTIEFDVTAMVAKAASSNWSTLTVGLRAIDEGTKNQWKRFNHASPKLAITYNTSPNAPTDRYSDGKPCATGSSRPYVLTTTPVLSVRQSDPDTSQQSLTTWFYWWPLGGTRNETDKVSQGSGNPSVVSKAVPPGKLVDGQTYVWQTRTYDGSHYGGWSGTCEFTVDATPPPAPGNVTSSDYPADGKPHGGVGLDGVFHVTAPSLRPYEVKEYAWTLDSGVLSEAKTVPARSSDHGASITIRPLHDGVNTLRVWAKDHAGRFSETPKTYTFIVRAGDGPAAEWTFDEADGDAVDVARHDNTAVLAGSATREAGRGGVGSALSLNGSTAYAATSGPVLAPHPDTGAMLPVRTDTSFTVTARVRLDSTGSASTQAVVAADGSRVFAYRLGYDKADNKWVFAMTGSDTDNATEVKVLSDAPATLGKWTHLAGVYDVSTKRLRLYVNGVEQSTTATLTGGFNATGPVRIGQRKWNGSYGGWIDGAVDDVRIYNFVESAAKIAELARPLPPAVSFPDNNEVIVGGQLTVLLDAGGDINITKFRYSVGNALLDKEVAATVPGGTAEVEINVGSVAGEQQLYVVAVDDGGRVSEVTQKVFTVTPVASLSGTVIDGLTFLPLANATVTLEPGGLTVVTGVDGGYSFDNLVPGTYTLTAVYGGRCGLSASVELDIPGPGEWRDIFLMPYTDGLGYTCAERAAPFLAADDTVLNLSGDDSVTEVELPFVFPFYGQAYRSVWVDTNGLLSFADPGGSHPYFGGQIPMPADPNALVAPFWDDLVVDASASVRTATVGSDSDERFVIEWRNVHRKGSTSQRLSFEVILAPDGTVTVNYDGLDNDAERGAHALVGIEAPAGEDGLLYSTGEPVLADGQAIDFDHPESGSPIEVYSLSGTLLDDSGAPVVGATVRLDPTGLSTITGPGGTWRFDELVADSYTVSSTVGGRCAKTVHAQVELSEDTVKELRLGPDYGTLGYACQVGVSQYVPASTVLALSGDDVATQVDLPFPFELHGRTYNTGWVHTNGLISFGDQPGTNTWANPTMPTAAAPNAVVAPFWDDLVVDASASVRTELIGTAPNRAFVVEWRDVRILNTGERLTFEAVLHEDGRVAFHYGVLNTTWTQGGAATVGIENASGTVAALYLYHQAALTSNSSIVYTPAPKGTVRGTLTTAVTASPVVGATVTLEPAGLVATTGADGSYVFPDLPVGEYTVTASTGDNRCAGQHARRIVNYPGGVFDVDLSLMIDGDEFGYRCEIGTESFVPGDVVEWWSGDDTVWQKNPPFPIKLYGQSYTSAWISANGVMTFRDPAYTGWIVAQSTPIPSPPAEGAPNAAVYVHWDDWVVDSQARIATKVSGTAPNRQWVVEWRDVHLWGNTSARASFEVIFHENGTITFAYTGIDADHARERGSHATIGIENGSGTIAFQYSHRESVLTSGQSITFQPNPPGEGSVTGMVTCQGAPVGGASVSMAGKTTTSAVDGTYRIDNVPAGTYAVIATVPNGSCVGSSVEHVVVGTDTEERADFPLPATPGGAGYMIAEQAVTYLPADTSVLPLAGDDDYTQIDLPFPVALYGEVYSSAWVDINGLVTFVDPGEPSPDAWPIPSPKSPREPNAAVYPFWHDWVVDAKASVRTAVRGTSPNRQFVVEWRNVHSYEDPTTRITFQVIFDEAGGFSFAYTDQDGTFLELGGGATIGIENADGTVALQYTYRQPVLRPGMGLRITPSAP